jgi:predicted ABC-type transport system involved in lysophospholipase L1 biosynthesis ATPase subunit
MYSNIWIGLSQAVINPARALMMQPSVLLADEPTGNLDKITSIQVQDLIFSLCAQLGTTLIVVTHDEDLARKFSKHLVMEDGKIVN